MAKILVVDDSKALRDLIDFLGSERGWQVVSAGFGIDGLEIFRTQGPFDIVFTDFGMPDIDGFQLIGEILKIKPDQKIVLMTGDLWENICVEFADLRQRGVKISFLGKPFIEKDFRVALEEFENET